ncbi:hypothetical protein HPB52_022949 [Rhipicephalus sanguineus]|uniref:Uncharacterized protein n=1 Tax=Rhipicephalus sanguineus TaxID=34632 RepID=A0A9D4PPD6_RHISA|nr:hypothetical protein HPB52_022949 [Rhipicephalus sanguineus]
MWVDFTIGANQRGGIRILAATPQDEEEQALPEAVQYLILAVQEDHWREDQEGTTTGRTGVDPQGGKSGPAAQAKTQYRLCGSGPPPEQGDHRERIW